MQQKLSGVYLNEYLRISKQLERIKYEYNSFLNKYNKKTKILKSSLISKSDLLEKYNTKSIRYNIVNSGKDKLELSQVKVFYLNKVKEYLLALKLIECIYEYDNTTINPLLFDFESVKSINLSNNSKNYLIALNNIKDANVKAKGVKMCKDYLIRNELIKDLTTDLNVLNDTINSLLKTSSVEDINNIKENIVKLNTYFECMLEDVKDKTEVLKVLKFK